MTCGVDDTNVLLKSKIIKSDFYWARLAHYEFEQGTSQES